MPGRRRRRGGQGNLITITSVKDARPDDAARLRSYSLRTFQIEQLLALPASRRAKMANPAAVRNDRSRLLLDDLFRRAAHSAVAGQLRRPSVPMLTSRLTRSLTRKTDAPRAQIPALRSGSSPGVGHVTDGYVGAMYSGGDRARTGNAASQWRSAGAFHGDQRVQFGVSFSVVAISTPSFSRMTPVTIVVR